MSRIGDFLPESERRLATGRDRRPGEVLRLWCEFTDPPKDKFVVVVSAGDSPLLFVINSRINPFIQKRPHLLRCQVRMAVSDYPFLDHDSFINCAEAIESVTQDAISAQLSGPGGTMEGDLSPDTIAAILRAAESATTLSEDHKQLIHKAFR